VPRHERFDSDVLRKCTLGFRMVVYMLIGVTITNKFIVEPVEVSMVAMVARG
jgi:hypothetical protein